jgi:hypothetical protein
VLVISLNVTGRRIGQIAAMIMVEVNGVPRPFAVVGEQLVVGRDSSRKDHTVTVSFGQLLQVSTSEGI